MSQGLDRETRKALGAVVLVAGLLGLALWRGGAQVPEEGVAASLALLTLGCLVRADSAVLALVWRTLLVLAPFVVVTASVILFVIAPSAALGELRAAAIAGLVVATGWIVAYLSQELRRLEERQERSRDLIRALRVEIRFELERSETVDWAETARKAKESFAADPQFRPLIPLRTRDHSIRRIADNIELLSDRQIPPVMSYYRMIDEIQQFIAATQSDAYEALDAGRREALFLGLIGLEERLAERSRAALSVLMDEE